ncbi:hypothetical protein BACCAP_04242 [Pseudoflavonifractor capillosus ATCC 29799]|uniref:Uncharacterized protein n=1 Tax=Pseudoflavonifractor capillosus ATCC 29799 TaxID=411467 RepID=A6P175_9FIRM|nr:hypothetical protein BACCAP_04242 [Pseudoflavonifractor capillosus ATCC 29799]
MPYTRADSADIIIAWAGGIRTHFDEEGGQKIRRVRFLQKVVYFLHSCDIILRQRRSCPSA